LAQSKLQPTRKKYSVGPQHKWVDALFWKNVPKSLYAGGPMAHICRVGKLGFGEWSPG
jgi:hypothetical protein